MAHIKKALALMLALCIICTVGVVAATAAEADTEGEEVGAGGITVHYYCEEGAPTIYYWNSLPQNLDTQYPGPAMTSEGGNWYKYSFSTVTKINMLFVVNGKQSAELTRESGEWWYKKNRWTDKFPQERDWDRSDLREDSIYFVITTRFYDGDTGNNVHCWDDKQANNPDDDPAWRGDFKGLIEKLDYIKALGFSAIWITPVVTNASGYDYHGYHAMDFNTVDVRYESPGATFQDLIDAAHEKDMKIIQDIVWNHTGNFGEEFLEKMFTKQYSSIQDLGSADCMKVAPGSNMEKAYPNYNSLQPGDQFQARLDILKDLRGTSYGDSKEHYHRERNMGYESEIEQTGSMAGDCVDLNTENPEVAKYITDAYKQYVDMGVDAFRLDTEKHINRWTLNSAYFPEFINNKQENFFIFGEVCSRVREVWNHNIPSSSPPFYTWKETESEWKSNWSGDTSKWEQNLENSKKHYRAHSSSEGAPTSQNTFLNGTSYHTPDYSQWNGTGVIDFSMHRNFGTASQAWGAGLAEDQYMNDSTWNVTYVDSHDYGPEDTDEKNRYSGGTQAWAENLDLIFTWRGIPCLYYGSEVEFQKAQPIDVGPNAPLATTGRAYFGDNITGNVSASDFGKYTASGKANESLNYPLAQHIRKLNLIRRAVTALQKGQYTTSNVSNSNMAFTRRYTANGLDSLACVTISGGATFNNLPNGKYIDAVTGDVKNVSNGTLSVPSVGSANMRVYVCCAPGFEGISGRIGDVGTYLK
ncbi:MAG: starch-binding protein [Ruminococcus sp.]|nr:starch-binding protein [Ruminococcus sp.]